MQSVAGLTAAHTAGMVGASAKPAKFQLVERRVSRVGDLVDMLKLTANQKVFEPQTVTVEEVIDEGTGRPVQASPDADILLIGDSFTNIYSQADLGWGAGAGFAEYLAYRLGRPLDVIALNGGGAWRGRAELARSENARRLGRKKAIVYEFAIRDFTSEDWRVVPMVNPIAGGDSADVPQVVQPVKQPAPNPAASPKSEHSATVNPRPESSPPKDVPLVVTGTILKTSKVPAPRTAPYKDCLTFIKIRVDNLVSGTYADSELIAAFWAMKDNEWLPAASYAVGDKVRLTLMPLNKTEPQIRSMQRADDLDDYTRQPLFVLQEGH
jgi:alginate O-acetyltransferase complex protein AlgJ